MSKKEEQWDEQMNLWRIQKLLPAAQLPASTTMPEVTYSREYLRGIPEQLRQQRKKQILQNVINAVVQPVTTAATNEKTSCIIEESVYASQQSHFQRTGVVTITTDDIIGALQEKFPDCIISFQEAWVDTAHNTRVLKKGILIDWS
jgi:hypothetical protein